jgi:dolichol-phosphate mannosyltransferase
MKYLIIIPTYDEAENIVNIIPAVLVQDEKIDVLVVDDNSPDNTADLVEKLAGFGKRIFLLKRKGKLGLGTAYMDGFTWAINNHYSYMISMDADFSHPPKALPTMLKLSQKHPDYIILGSRYVRGGKIVGWDFRRYANSYVANFATRILLRLRVKDATAGFKCYPASFIKMLDFSKLTASGYAFQVEMLYLANLKKVNIVEFPIVFTDRRAGESKISGELMRSAKVVFNLFAKQVWVREFIKFCVVGLTCTVIDWGIYFLIKELSGWETQELKQIMKALSFVGSVGVSYLLNRIWTFRSKDKQVFTQAVKFFSMAVVGLGLNNLFFYLSTGYLKFTDIIGLFVATALVMFWNFTISRVWVFRKN